MHTTYIPIYMCTQRLACGMIGALYQCQQHQWHQWHRWRPSHRSHPHHSSCYSSTLTTTIMHTHVYTYQHPDVHTIDSRRMARRTRMDWKEMNGHQQEK